MPWHNCYQCRKQPCCPAVLLRALARQPLQTLPANNWIQTALTRLFFLIIQIRNRVHDTCLIKFILNKTGRNTVSLTPFDHLVHTGQIRPGLVCLTELRKQFTGSSQGIWGRFPCIQTSLIHSIHKHMADLVPRNFYRLSRTSSLSAGTSQLSFPFSHPTVNFHSGQKENFPFNWRTSQNATTALFIQKKSAETSY